MTILPYLPVSVKFFLKKAERREEIAAFKTKGDARMASPPMDQGPALSRFSEKAGLFRQSPAAHHIVPLGIGGKGQLAVGSDLRTVGGLDQPVIGSIIGIEVQVRGIHTLERNRNGVGCGLIDCSILGSIAHQHKPVGEIAGDDSLQSGGTPRRSRSRGRGGAHLRGIGIDSLRSGSGPQRKIRRHIGAEIPGREAEVTVVIILRKQNEGVILLDFVEVFLIRGRLEFENVLIGKPRTGIKREKIERGLGICLYDKLVGDIGVAEIELRCGGKAQEYNSCRPQNRVGTA